MEQTYVLILAAGYGKRMNSELPKALAPLGEKPLISHLLDRVNAANVTQKPVIVVGQKKEMVMAELGDGYDYAFQEEQLGTGHAVLSAEATLPKTGNLIVLFCDQPWVSPFTIQEIVRTHTEENAVLTMATTTVPDFEEWRAGFTTFSRIIRNPDGTIARTVENKDATEDEKLITEVNPCYFCFDMEWLWQNLKTLKHDNAQQEYYLTDLIGMAFSQNKKIATIAIDPLEALGVNTKEHLELLETLLSKNPHAGTAEIS